MLDRYDWRGQRVLLLQGPVGPYFARLARDLRARGATVDKINFNGGDLAFFPGGSSYTGDLAAWPGWLRQRIERGCFTAVAMFGDCRPIHAEAAEVCRLLGVPCYVFEEGYFRPGYITCELGGVNDKSAIPRDASFYRAQVTSAPSLEVQPPSYAYWAMMVWTCLYYLSCTLAWPRYRRYRHHRPLRLIESLFWVRGGARKWWRGWVERDIEVKLLGEWSGRFFLVPLQVHNDAQVTHHSRFASVEDFIAEVALSFARHAPTDHLLVFKHHPMDRAYRNYAALIRRLAEVHDLPDRLIYIHDQHLPTLLTHACGVVVINSTTGLCALHQNAPTIVLGNASYDFEGLTCQAPLDQFWRQPSAHRPDRELYLAFRQWVIQNTQINDSFYAGPLQTFPATRNGAPRPSVSRAESSSAISEDPCLD